MGSPKPRGPKSLPSSFEFGEDEVVGEKGIMSDQLENRRDKTIEEIMSIISPTVDIHNTTLLCDSVTTTAAAARPCGHQKGEGEVAYICK